MGVLEYKSVLQNLQPLWQGFELNKKISKILDTQLFFKKKKHKKPSILENRIYLFLLSIKWRSGREVKLLALNLRAGIGLWVRTSLGMTSFHVKMLLSRSNKFVTLVNFG